MHVGFSFTKALAKKLSTFMPHLFSAKAGAPAKSILPGERDETFFSCRYSVREPRKVKSRPVLLMLLLKLLEDTRARCGCGISISGAVSASILLTADLGMAKSTCREVSRGCGPPGAATAPTDTAKWSAQSRTSTL